MTCPEPDHDTTPPPSPAARAAALILSSADDELVLIADDLLDRDETLRHLAVQLRPVRFEDGPASALPAVQKTWADLRRQLALTQAVVRAHQRAVDEELLARDAEGTKPEPELPDLEESRS